MNERRTIVCGSFELLEPVGRGGVATVWRGRHRRRDVPVAVKVIDGDDTLGRDVREAFRREVRAHAGLDHPGIATVFEYGRISTDAEVASDGRLTAGSPYCALEYSGSGSIRAQRSIDNWPLLQSFLLEVLDALAYAHARGVIHRDLKPENVLYFPGEPRGRFKLTDFGIAHAIGGEVGAETDEIEDAAAGTPQYMPPEQVQGEWRVFGPWTDLYGLGCMAYEMASGSVPFDGESVLQIASRQLTERPEPLEPRFPVPRGFSAWVRCLLAKDIRDRFRRAADAAWMLSRMPSSSGAEGGRRARGGSAKPDTGSAGPEGGKAEFTGDRTWTQPMWAVEEAADRSELGRRRTLQFESREARMTTLPDHVPSEPTRDLTDPPDSDDETTRLEAAFQTGPPPPLPGNWRHRLHETPSAAFVDAGLELFGLRERPFVGREEGRDACWELLETVSEREEPHVLEIAGPSGIGKTRLAEWAARRVHEVGAAETLWAPHSRRGGPTEGLPAMLEAKLSLWGLDRERSFRRIQTELQARYDRMERSARAIDDEARALTELVAPTSGGAESRGGPTHRFASPEERFDVAARFLEELARERPLFVVLDDVHWGLQSACFMEYVLQTRPELPVLFAATVRDEDLEEQSGVVDLLDRVRATDVHRRLELGPLEGATRAELCHRLLPLEFEAAERLVDASRGRPLDAVQRLASWVDRDALEADGSGFELRDDLEVPDGDLDDVWGARLEAVLDELTRTEGPEAVLSFELAAVLGPHIDLDEWRVACERAGIEAHDEVHETLIRMGLARSKTQGWSFVHRQLGRRLEERARRQGRWRDHHLLCAEMLQERYGDRYPRMQRRVAEHFRTAGAEERALAPMLGFGRHLFDRGAYSRVERLLEEHADLLERAVDTPEHRVGHLRLRGRLAARKSQEGRVREVADRLRRLGEEYEDDRALGWAELFAARVAADTDGALEHLDAARRLFDDRDELGRALVARERGRALLSGDRAADAVEHLERSAEQLRRQDRRTASLRTRIDQARALRRDGRAEAAEEVLRGIAEDSADLGCDALRARAWKRLGQLYGGEGGDGRAAEANERADTLRPPDLWSDV